MGGGLLDEPAHLIVRRELADVACLYVSLELRGPRVSWHTVTACWVLADAACLGGLHGGGTFR